MFYERDPRILEKEALGFIGSRKNKRDVIGCISPHAGYMYSGAVSGAVIASMGPKQSYIILGPNHTGLGLPFGVDRRDWLTPLGEVKADQELADLILAGSDLFEDDVLCHSREHSIEVQLPILQSLGKEFTFVPIVIGGGGLAEYEKLGLALARAVKASKKSVSIIASSDMTHYQPHEFAKEQDRAVIGKILELDIRGFLQIIEERDVSMCGYAPSAIMLVAAKELGAKRAELIDYRTSAEASGDYSSVVGYAGIVVY